MALTLEQTEKFSKLIQTDSKSRFKENKEESIQAEASLEDFQKKKERLVKIFESRMLVNSISRGVESPSKVADFNDRGFHGKMSLF